MAARPALVFTVNVMLRLLLLVVSLVLAASQPAFALVGYGSEDDVLSSGLDPWAGFPHIEVLSSEVQELEPGLELARLTLGLPGGSSARATVLSWGRYDDRFFLQPLAPSSSSPSTAPWSDAVATLDWGVSAAVVNGGYWRAGGVPNGLWVDGGDLRSVLTLSRAGDVISPARSALLASPSGEVMLGRADLEASLVVDGHRELALRIDGLPPPGGVSLLTEGSPVRLSGRDGFFVLPLREVRLGVWPVSASSSDASLLPALVTSDPRLASVLSDPARLTLEVAVVMGDGSRPAEASTSLAGAPLLLSGGVPAPGLLGGVLPEALSRSHVHGRHPRTAVALSAERIMLVVVDGRQPGWSSGVALSELSSLLFSLGASDALNLDGGGSSRMWVEDGPLTRPSERERSVSGMLAVQRRALVVDPFSLSVERLGPPGAALAWCEVSPGVGEPFLLSGSSWYGRSGRRVDGPPPPSASSGTPFCLGLDPDMSPAIRFWDDGVVSGPEGDVRIAGSGWDLHVEDMDGDGVLDVGARRGPVVRWLDQDGALRLSVVR